MDTTIGFPNTQLYSDFTMQLLNNWPRNGIAISRLVSVGFKVHMPYQHLLEGLI